MEMEMEMEMEMDINQIRLNYKQYILNNENNENNEYNELQPVLKFIMTNLEKQHIANNLHQSFCLFADDNIAYTNPTYESLTTQTTTCKFTELELKKAYVILFNKPSIVNPTEIIPTKTICYSKYRDVLLPFGIASKTEILTQVGISHKITDLDRKLMKLTKQTIQQLRLSNEEKKNLINKIKLLRAIYKKTNRRTNRKKLCQ